MPMKRREFVKTSAVCGSVAGLFPTIAISSVYDGGSTATWFDKPMRWAQLTLVENDPGQYDPDFWLDYFSRTHSDASCLSAGGIVAYYPTKIEFHHRSFLFFTYGIKDDRSLIMIKPTQYTFCQLVQL